MNTLLFDLGGVIMNIKRENAVRAFEILGMADADGFFDPYEQHGSFGLLEAGQISPEEFRADVRRNFRPGVTDEEIDSALCEFLLGIPAERLARLKELREKSHKVYMLSNTNPIMWDRYIIPSFPGGVENFFDGTVTSFEAGVCKPASEIYEYAIRKFNLRPGETIFYDDGPANIAAAARLGFQTRLVTDEDDMLKLTADA